MGVLGIAVFAVDLGSDKRMAVSASSERRLRAAVRPDLPASRVASRIPDSATHSPTAHAHTLGQKATGGVKDGVDFLLHLPAGKERSEHSERTCISIHEKRIDKLVACLSISEHARKTFMRLISVVSEVVQPGHRIASEQAEDAKSTHGHLLQMS